MNWKFRASLVITVILAAVIWFKMPSQAETEDSEKNSAAAETASSAIQEKTTQYENGVMRIEPMNFAVSGKVRDMPTIDKDALVKGAAFKDMRTWRKERAEIERQNREIEAPESEEEEINRINAKKVRKVIPGAGDGENFQDPLIGKESLVNSPQAMPTPSLTFNGATAADNTATLGFNVLPPDVNGDVGPSHYVSSVNLVLRVFDKSGGNVAGPIATNALFASLPAGDPCRVTNNGDPIVMYDSLADRWHISQFGVPARDNQTYQCVALSQTGDPAGAYFVWSYAYQNSVFNDYPKVGVWTDAYHMTFNQFNLAGTAFLGLGVLSQDREKALVGDPNASAIYLNVGAIDRNSGGALPGDIDGYVAPPAGMPEIIGEYRANEFGDPVDGIRIYKWIPNFSNPGASTLTILPDVALAPFDARQPNTRNAIEVMGAAPNQYLDSLADRSMHRFAYRNFGTPESPINSYVGNFAVNVSGVTPSTAATYQTGIRWFEMRRSNDTFSVFDQGTHVTGPIDGATGTNNWMGSIAQDVQGNIGLGYSQASTTQLADIKIAGRTNNVENSGTLNEGEALFHAATGRQTSTSGRWGDYSAMNVDPSDGCTFWYTQEYYAVTSSAGWSTRVGKFRFPSCTDAPRGNIAGTITNCATGAPIDRVDVDATGGFNRLTASNGTFSLTAAPGNYTVTANKFGFAPSSATIATVENGGTAPVNICLTPVAALRANGAPTISSESCSAPNNSPDPGEQVSVNLVLQNDGAVGTASNVMVTLLSTGGITALNNPQDFGTIASGGSAAGTFNFKVDSTLACGSTVTLSFRISDGTNNFDTITRTFTTGVLQQTASENFDGVTAPALPEGWTTQQISGASNPWVTSTTTPNSPPNSAFAANLAVSSSSALVSPAFPIQTTGGQLSFRNRYNTQATFDGMVLEFSTNNGTSWTDILTGGGSFVSGRYNSFLFNSRAAWSGNSGSYVDTVVNLPASLNGQNVRFRWVMISNSSVAVVGVNVDDVRVSGARECSACSAAICQIQRRSDFASDGKSDYSLFRPSTGDWYVGTNGSPSFYSVHFGQNGDILQPRDYDSDGKTDLAVFRDGAWFILKSSDNTFNSTNWGLATDIPVAADYTGDGKADIAVYRPSQGGWYILRSDTNTEQDFLWGGDPTDVPIVGDFDGDCKSDLAVRRTTNASSPGDTSYFISGSTAGFIPVRWGRSEFLTAIGDYNGDGRADIGVVDPNSYRWFIASAVPQTVLVSGVAFGSGGDIVAAADYDGDGTTDYGVFRPSIGAWFTAPITTPNPGQNFNSLLFGAPGDIPTTRWNQYPLP